MIKNKVILLILQIFQLNKHFLKKMKPKKFYHLIKLIYYNFTKNF